MDEDRGSSHDPKRKTPIYAVDDSESTFIEPPLNFLYFYRLDLAGNLLATVYSNCQIRCKLLESKARATLAQLVERLIRNQQVAGSIPAGGSS
jgi:hypothetical protein